MTEDILQSPGAFVPEMTRLVDPVREVTPPQGDPIILLAYGLAESASKNIKAKSDEISGRYGIALGAMGARNLLFDESRKDVETIYLTSTIVGLDGAINTGVLNNSSIIDRINALFAQTPLRALNTTNLPQREEIDPAALQVMREARSKDPSYLDFFKNPDLIPLGLRKHLEDFHLLQAFEQDGTLGMWENNAKRALEKAAKEKAKNESGLVFETNEYYASLPKKVLKDTTVF